MIPCPVHPTIWLERASDGWRCATCAKAHYALVPPTRPPPDGDAVQFFLEAALRFAFDEYALKAIAVAGQVLKLQPMHFGARVFLASQYRSIGLESDALVALKPLATGTQEPFWLAQLGIRALLN